MQIRVLPSEIAGSLRVPPSKSMAHRMLICAALAGGVSHIGNLDPSQDIEATRRTLTALGAEVTLAGGTATIKGLPQTPADWQGETAADCGESGSTLRFMIPLFALSGKEATLTGASRLFQRPLSVYEDLFKNQNLLFQPGECSVRLGGPLRGGTFTVAGNVSSQFISGLLFALPLLSHDSTIHIIPPFESKSYVELTQNAQAHFGIKSEWKDENTLHVPGGQIYTSCDTEVEGDWSQAGVPAVLAAVKGPLTLTGLRRESAQGDKIILDILKRCNAAVSWQGSTVFIAPAPLLSPGSIDLSDCPDLGPILCVLTLFCEGTTCIENAGRLRIKESDRIASMEAELRKLGAQITSDEDSITIVGGRPLHGGAQTLSHNDHRVVMALTAAAVCSRTELTIEGAEAVRKSWPGFFEDMAGIGVKTEEI